MLTNPCFYVLGNAFRVLHFYWTHFQAIPRLTRLVFSRFFYIRRNLGNVKEKPTRKTCFSREMKPLT